MAELLCWWIQLFFFPMGVWTTDLCCSSCVLSAREGLWCFNNFLSLDFICSPYRLLMLGIWGQAESYNSTRDLTQTLWDGSSCNVTWHLPSLESSGMNQWILLYSMVINDIWLFVLPMSWSYLTFGLQMSKLVTIVCRKALIQSKLVYLSYRNDINKHSTQSNLLREQWWWLGFLGKKYPCLYIVNEIQVGTFCGCQ